MRDPAPLTVLETHAGAGLYDLGSAAARRSDEAQAGIARLLAAPDPPAALHRLARAVRAARGRFGARAYPGSPMLAAAMLRAGDRYVGWELRTDDRDRLGAALARHAPSGARLEARGGDGYAAAPRLFAPRRLVMIDPPFEAGDEAQRLANCAAELMHAPGTSLAIWAPLKDLDSFDRLLRGVQDAGAADVAAVELRLRGLDDPLRLNGCAMILLDTPPEGLAAATQSAGWLAAALGDEGAMVEVRHRQAGPSATRARR